MKFLEYFIIGTAFLYILYYTLFCIKHCFDLYSTNIQEFLEVGATVFILVAFTIAVGFVGYLLTRLIGVEL